MQLYAPVCVGLLRVRPLAGWTLRSLTLILLAGHARSALCSRRNAKVPLREGRIAVAFRAIDFVGVLVHVCIFRPLPLYRVCFAASGVCGLLEQQVLKRVVKRHSERRAEPGEPFAVPVDGNLKVIPVSP